MPDGGALPKMLTAALDYAARGIPVFPVRSIGKKKKPLSPNGFKNATTDPAIITSWWRQWPDAMIGAPTGAASRLVLFDVDVDEDEGIDGEASLAALIAREGQLPDTVLAATPRGGRHLYFQHPGRKIKNSAGSLGQGLDIRGDGGFTVFAPSVRDDGKAYRWVRGLNEIQLAPMPEWLLNLIAPPEAERKPQQQHKQEKHRHADRYVEKALNDEMARVRSAPVGQRNETLNRAAYNLGQLVGGGLIDRGEVERALRAAAADLAADDGADTVEKTIASGIDAGIKQPRQPREREKRRPNGAADPRGLDGFDLTEDGVALAFAAKFKDRLRYCHHTGAWFEWTGSYWRREETKLAFSWARHTCRELARGHEASGRDASTMARAATAAAVERFAQADRAFAVTSAIWDQDPMLLGTPSGVVDLRMGELRPAAQADFITKLTAVVPAETSNCPLWLKFLDEATGGDFELVRFLQQWAGYCLTGDTREHALLFVYGPGGNGKTVWLNTMAGILADYAKNAAMETFTASQNDRHPTELAMLKGARMVCASETEEGRAWAEVRIKQLTGGDTISARFMRQDFFEYRPQFKLTVIGNHKPVLRNVDDAARRRFNVVPFTRNPAVPDKQLEKKLKAEWPAILRWMIEGCIDWRENGLMRPTTVVDATTTYFSEQDILRQWLDECCDEGPFKSDTVDALFKSWANYALANGEKPGTTTRFSQAMQRFGFVAVKHTPGRNSKRGFTGVEVKPVDTSDQYQNRQDADGATQF